jgi:hypothetical protein
VSMHQPKRSRFSPRLLRGDNVKTRDDGFDQVLPSVTGR